MLKEKLHIFLQYITPHHLLSRWIGKLADCRWPLLKNLFISVFIKAYQVDMAEAMETDPKKYENFNDFFTRALKPDARPLVAAANQLACPADGFVSEIGAISNDKIFQAKNFSYRLASLLGNSDLLAQQFADGAFATVYLAPKNYHRVHMPYTGTLQQMIYVPGKLFSVNPNTVNHVPDLFARNERVIAIFSTDMGTMAVILVGAMIVAGIETVWAGQIAPSATKELQTWNYSKQHIVLKKGDELGRFKLGSTVIVLLQKDRVSWAPLHSKDAVKMGEFLGTVL